MTPLPYGGPYSAKLTEAELEGPEDDMDAELDAQLAEIGRQLEMQ